jgi:predicted metal-dependent hydrolase
MANKQSNLKILRLGECEVTLMLRRVRGARRMTLRLDEAAGAFHLSLPYGVALTEGLDFAARRRRWILAQLAALPPRVAFAAGAEIPLFGVPHVIRHDPGARRGAWREAGTIWVSGFAEHLPRRVTDFLKAEARRELTARAHGKAAEIGRRVAKVSLRDTRSRWGSCSAEGEIGFSWRLILAPEAVLDYVVAHEVAHLAHMNHGPRFWRLVAKLTPEVAGPRHWLKANGCRLHRYG